MSENIIALVDCNSFFCSCERVFQPRLAKKPVLVLSNNDGCVVARTDEVKKLGIKMGEPYFKIKEFCKINNISVFSSNFALYGDMSRRVMRILASHAPEIEIYSIDEAFLSLAGFKKSELVTHSNNIINDVRQCTGIPVSIGIGPTKVLAKLANNFAKKNKEKTKGVVNVYDYSNPDELLKSTPVGEIWGVGRRSAEKLVHINIKTAFDLKYSNEKVIQRLLTINGRKIVEELRGNSCISLELDQVDKKQIISSRSFGRSVYKIEELKEAVANHISTAAEKLRKQDCVTKSVLVFVQTNPFKNTPQYYNSATVNFLSGTAVTNKLIKSAMSCLESIYRGGYEYKKAGVILMDFHKRTSTQLDLFQSFDSQKEELLMRTIDRINRIQGKGTVKFAACGIDQFWKMLSEMKSRNYSTRWSELLEV